MIVRRRGDGRSGWSVRRGARRPGARRGGMTLVEVLAVVVILGLLGATLAVGVSGAFGKGKRELARAGIGLLAGRVESYYIDAGAWPDASLGLAALSDGHAAPTAAYYIKPEQALDPWGTPYQLIIPGPGGHPFEIVSLGSDRRVGGAGEAADLSSISLRDPAP